ncbi:hypothetical protein AVEN_219250-1 [Araneus ventricosus]|uniref:Uncharacterized protein n=1 Tax=Araneus ventricosus TaxID=182803 RepID=A0A4Y2L3G8_ARAVE|nr:hypothetical protein AVEN_219250-1 [Araneus ventricosus]
MGGRKSYYDPGGTYSCYATHHGDKTLMGLCHFFKIECNNGAKKYHALCAPFAQIKSLVIAGAIYPRYATVLLGLDIRYRACEDLKNLAVEKFTFGYRSRLELDSGVSSKKN